MFFLSVETNRFLDLPLRRFGRVRDIIYRSKNGVMNTSGKCAVIGSDIRECFFD